MSLLTHVKTIEQPKTSLFNASQFFVEGKQPDGIKFWLGYNFKEHFLKGNKIVVPDGSIHVYRLNENSVDAPIINKLGGEKQVETSLFHLAELIKKQAKGQEGDLLTNGYANIFYIRGFDGELWAVYCLWDSGAGGWDVDASPVAGPYGWGAGSRVFSRGSLVNSDPVSDDSLKLDHFDPTLLRITYDGKSYRLEADEE
jgi:hypothetical protein